MIIRLNRNEEIPLYIQICERIYDLIAEGLLPPGSQLPTSRHLADSLGVSRNTVVVAYQELEARGLISSQVGRGTFVRKHLPQGIGRGTKPAKQKMHFEGLFSVSWLNSYSPFHNGMEQLSGTGADTDTISFASAFPDRALFPLEDFRDCLLGAMKRYGSDLLTSGSPRGFQELIDYLPLFLARRGILCESRDIMVASGIQQGLSIMGRLFLDPGDTVVLENLTYPGALLAFRSLQANCVGIPVDSEGMRVDVLENVLKRRKVKLLYTIPTFHNPTGSVLAAERRERLVELCREYQVILIEDDYAYELSYDGKGILPLKSLDEWEGIIYMGSFSEILFPGIRLSWILAPHSIIERLLLIKQSSDLFTNRILQGAIVDFCRKGFLEKYLKKTRHIYRRRRDVMAQSIERYFPEEVSWEKPSGGLFQWIDLSSDIDALSVLLRTRERGVVFAPDRMFCVEEWERGGFRMGFAGLEEERIEQGIRIVGESIKEMITKER